MAENKRIRLFLVKTSSGDLFYVLAKTIDQAIEGVESQLKSDYQSQVPQIRSIGFPNEKNLLVDPDIAGKF